MRVDVLVIGAGPAGCAAAAALAGAGARVVIAERHGLPREKVCGDGLLPDAVTALDILGVEAEARRVGQRARALQFRAGSGGTVTLPVEALVVRRSVLDGILLRNALARGAELADRAELVAARWSEDTLKSVVLATPAGTLEMEADSFVLATGAATRPRRLLGFTVPRRRGAVALRGYATLTGRASDELLVSFDPALAGGYAWAFPVGGGIWNVGCGLTAANRRSPSLGRALQQVLVDLGGGGWLERPQGAPVASAFPALRLCRGNVAAVGDAAGLTVPFSGEGIGPALESGLLVARHLLDTPGAAGAAGYARALRRRFLRDYRAWRLGERFLHHPRLAEMLIARAQHPGALRRLAGVLAGTVPASRVLTPLGLLRLFLRR